MIIIGLTGSIAMGKSLTAKFLKEQGIPVFDADETVHSLYDSNKKIIKEIRELCPNCVINNKIDRQKLAGFVKNNRKLEVLERIIHPKVSEKKKIFLKKSKEDKHAIVVLDIPLLFESGAYKLCDKIIVVTAPWYTQLRRAIKRKGMSVLKIIWLNSKQMSPKKKCAKADFIIYTNNPKEKTKQKVIKILEQIKQEANNGS